MTSYSSFVSHRSAIQVGKNPKEEEEEAAPMVASVDQDAVSYVETVKDAFKEDHPAKYHEFLLAMDDYRNDRIGIAKVASRVKALFRGSPGLIVGFNVFLPEGYKIQVFWVDELAAGFVRDMRLDDDDDDNVRDMILDDDI